MKTISRPAVIPHMDVSPLRWAPPVPLPVAYLPIIRSAVGLLT